MFGLHRNAFEEIPTRRYVVKQVLYRNIGAHRRSICPLFQYFTALNPNILCHLILRPARFHLHLSHRSNGSHRFAPEPVCTQMK